jgi:hypothetical protein
MTSSIIKVGDTSVTVRNDEFGNGMQIGYLQFHTEYQGKPLSDSDIYGVIAQNIYSVRRTSTYNAGFVVGWIKGLLEADPQHHRVRAMMEAIAEPHV